MRYLILFLLCLFFSKTVLSQNLSRYKIHLVGWDKSRLTGRVEAVTDTSLSLKIKVGKYKGRVFTFSASQTKNLKIWKPGINLPATLFGAAAVAFTGSQIAEEGLEEAMAVIVGIPVGSALGLFIGDQISTKVDIRRMRATNFSFVRLRLQRDLERP